MHRPIITLTTDFGRHDPFAGVMKGVILGICPEARIVDLVHEIEPQDIARASRVLGDSFRFFPPGTVHVAVVDPGVGTSRRAIALALDGHVFVGPDNGLFTNATRGGDVQAYVLENRRYFLPRVSQTFHGRDVFAPVAAWIARGTPLHDLGPVVSDVVMLPEERPRVDSGRQITGRISGFDRFGNAETNITAEDMGATFGPEGFGDLHLYVGNHGRFDVVRTYGDGENREAGALINSSNRLEVFVCGGNVRTKLGLRAGDEVKLSRKKERD